MDLNMLYMHASICVFAQSVLHFHCIDFPFLPNDFKLMFCFVDDVCFVHQKFH
jgi:hypothetical protein